MLTLQVKEQIIENLTPDEKFIRGTVGAKCQIKFDEFWSKYEKTVVFQRKCQKPINIIVNELDNEIEIPYEILEKHGKFKIGVFGIIENEVLPTLWSTDIEILCGTDTHGTNPQTYTPSEIDQLRLSKQDKLTAGDNITIDENNVISSGGTTDYALLENKPQINGIELLGNKSLTDLGITTNIKNSIGSSSLQQVQDSRYTGIAIKTKNPNAYALDNTLTDNEPIGATGEFASSFGGASSAQGKRSFSEGTNTIAKGKYSHAEGDNSVALGNDSHTEGLNCVSFGSGSHSEGGSTQAIGMHAHSEGVNTIARGTASHTGGSGSIANGIHSFAHGNNVIAGYDNQFVVGRFNNNRSDSIFEVGLGSSDTNRSTCFYINNNGAAYSNYSLGYDPKDLNRYATQVEVAQAIDTYATVINGGANSSVVLRGGQNSALYDGCVALGTHTTASGIASAAFNSNTKATGNNSSAIGEQTTASGIASHSQGYFTQAKGANSHAEGVGTIAEGVNSHAEGVGSYAKGAHSHAQGNNTQALLDNSSAAGNRTIAGYANQFIVGRFNRNTPYTIFEVGNGANDSNRSNAFEVYDDGHAEVKIMGTTDNSITTKKYVDDKISAIPSGGTTDYELLENKPQINGVELLGNKSLSELGIEIPTKTSELENDSGFIDDTAFENYYTKTEVDDKISEIPSGGWEVVMEYTTTADDENASIVGLDFANGNQYKKLFVIIDESGISGTTYMSVRFGVRIKKTNNDTIVNSLPNTQNVYKNNTKYKTFYAESITTNLYLYRVTSEVQLFGYTSSPSVGRYYNKIEDVSKYYGICWWGTIYEGTKITVYGVRV